MERPVPRWQSARKPAPQSCNHRELHSASNLNELGSRLVLSTSKKEVRLLWDSKQKTHLGHCESAELCSDKWALYKAFKCVKICYGSNGKSHYLTSNPRLDERQLKREREQAQSWRVTTEIQGDLCHRATAFPKSLGLQTKMCFWKPEMNTISFYTCIFSQTLSLRGEWGNHPEVIYKIQIYQDTQQLLMIFLPGWWLLTGKQLRGSLTLPFLWMKAFPNMKYACECAQMQNHYVNTILEGFFSYFNRFVVKMCPN